MFPGMETIACPNLAVPAQVMRHVVHVESGANPFAIGVVGGRLVRQPKSLEEARATAQMLESGGYNYSLGAAQVNRVNFRKYGLDSYEKAFDPCTNLRAGADILAGCYTKAGGNWGKAFSCYYSGNFETGFRTGYVKKVYDSINRGVTVTQASPTPSAAIPLHPTGAPSTTFGSGATSTPIGARPRAGAPAGTAASRISMRVVPPGTSVPMAPASATAAMPMAPAPIAAVPAVSTTAPAPPTGGPAGAPEVFVPLVRHADGSSVPAAATRAVSVDRPAGDGAFVF